VIVDPIPGGDIFEQIASRGIFWKQYIICANSALPNMKKTLSGIPIFVFQRLMTIMSAIEATAPVHIVMEIANLNLHFANRIW
jgi:hypothetical protein